MSQKCIFSDSTDEKQLAAEKEQNQPEAEEQGSPEEQRMETNTGGDAGEDVEKTERDRLKEAKVGPVLMSLAFSFSVGVFVCNQQQQEPPCSSRFPKASQHRGNHLHQFKLGLI